MHPRHDGQQRQLSPSGTSKKENIGLHAVAPPKDMSTPSANSFSAVFGRASGMVKWASSPTCTDANMQANGKQWEA